jgi:hypothetical protein
VFRAPERCLNYCFVKYTSLGSQKDNHAMSGDRFDQSAILNMALLAENLQTL